MVHAVIQLKVDMVEKSTSEIFLLGFVNISSYNLGERGYCLFSLVPFPDLLYSIRAHGIRQIQTCVCINFEKSGRFLTRASCDCGLF